MLTSARTPTSAGPFTVCLHPAKDAYDYEYFRDRLAEPAMLAEAVAVRVFRAPLLAVPVGGQRRGGYMSFDLLPLAMTVRGLLADLPGFPDLRVRWSPYRDTCHTVEWGAPAPDWWEDDAVFGRFYGYSDAAIEQYTAVRRPRASTAPAASCPALMSERPPA